MINRATPTGREVSLDENEFIVSKTDTTGKIIYANRPFMRIAEFGEHELLGVQHNIVRHRDMPRSVFFLMWRMLQHKEEFFGYVKNMCRNGDHYWVLANVTPDFNARKEVVGYFSVRRKPRRDAVEKAEKLYRKMLAAEQKAGKQKAIEAGSKVLTDTIKEAGHADYETFVLSL